MNPRSLSCDQGDVKARMKGEERARIKACSWATRSVENSGQKHRKTGKAGAGPLGQSQAQ